MRKNQNLNLIVMNVAHKASEHELFIQTMKQSLSKYVKTEAEQ